MSTHQIGSPALPSAPMPPQPGAVSPASLAVDLPVRSPPTVLLIVAGVLLLAGAVGARITFADGQMLAAMLGMVALLLLGVAAVPPAVSMRRVEGDPTASAVILTAVTGGRIVLPRSVFSQAGWYAGAASSANRPGSPPQVWLEKHDGGKLQLCQPLGGKAEGCAARLDALLAAVPPQPAAEAQLFSQIEARLAASSRVALNRASPDDYRGHGRSALELSWSRRRSPVRLLGIPVFAAAVSVIILDLIGLLSIYAVLVCTLLSAVAAFAAHRRAAKGQQRVIIDERGLRVQSEPAEPTDIPLSAIAAIDMPQSEAVTVRLWSTHDEILRLRAQKQGESARQSPGAINPTWESVVYHGMSIDVHALPYGERCDLELLIGAEIAQRTGRPLGTL